MSCNCGIKTSVRPACACGSGYHQGGGSCGGCGGIAAEPKTCEMCDKKGDAVKKVPIVWVLGGPGSGKGTQCAKIVEKYGFTHLSTGDLLRNEVSSGSARGKELQGIMEQGKLVSNDIMIELLKEAIKGSEATAKGFLIDGYPREKEQGALFEKAISPVDAILYFECKDETLVKRLLGRAVDSGRADDNEETIKLRIQTFKANNDQVLSLYPTKLIRINAERDVDDIFKDVVEVLNPLVA